MNQQEHDAALELLRAKRAELTPKQVAMDLGCSESAIRGICAGCYAGNPERLLAKAVAFYSDRVQCPFAGESIPKQQCQAISSAPKPFGGNVRARWWAACQSCPLKPPRQDGADEPAPVR